MDYKFKNKLKINHKAEYISDAFGISEDELKELIKTLADYDIQKSPSVSEMIEFIVETYRSDVRKILLGIYFFGVASGRKEILFDLAPLISPMLLKKLKNNDETINYIN